jgi:hypothetical protein
MQNGTSRNRDYLYIHDLRHGNYNLNIHFADAMSPRAEHRRHSRRGMLHNAVKLNYLHGR